MLLFYIDESGNRDPRLKIPRADGSLIDGDPIYVLTAVSLFEHRWHGFEKTLNRHKNRLISSLSREKHLRLDLPDAELKSNWLRQPKARADRPFLANLAPDELERLVDLFYQQLGYHHMNIFAVVADKRHLRDYMDAPKLHRKTWELLLELVEQFMRNVHPRHQAIMVNDDVGREANRSLALKHAYILDQGTAEGTWLRHICEMPMFVRSELSNGVQLADLCSYNIYRAFKTGDLAYPFFARIVPHIWSRSNAATKPFSGIRVFPENSPMQSLVDAFEKQRAGVLANSGSEMVSGGANPIEPTSGTGQKTD
ncbi:MAG: DUF3800 domain-containing protein [Verrucomicrobia bacterium]|nr:DUF3800 domain-containing protein [Verrucomicrobiota bacterium]